MILSARQCCIQEACLTLHLSLPLSLSNVLNDHWWKMELNVPIFSPHGWLSVFGAPEMSSPLRRFEGKRGIADLLIEDYIHCGPWFLFKTRSGQCIDSLDLYLNGEGEHPGFPCCITGGRYRMAGHGSPQGGADHGSSPWVVPRS